MGTISDHVFFKSFEVEWVHDPVACHGGPHRLKDELGPALDQAVEVDQPEEDTQGGVLKVWGTRVAQRGQFLL